MKTHVESPQWKFEAFGAFLNYEILAKTSIVLERYDGIDVTDKPILIREIEYQLEKETRKIWTPERKTFAHLNSIQGENFLRNKRRLLTSMYIIYPKGEKGDIIKLTEFSRALAQGRITRKEFYNYIIKNYSYPHPAYEEDTSDWKIINTTLHPMRLILGTLVNYYLKYNASIRLTAYDIYDVFIKESKFVITKETLNRLHEIKSKNITINVEKEKKDKYIRKINDIFRFLAMSGYVYYNKDGIELNLIDIHPEEKTWFSDSREGFSALTKFKSLLEIS